MGDTLNLDGHTWTREEAKPCSCCRVPTFRMWRRTRTELIWDRYPGTNGAHTFTSRRPSGPGRLFYVCHACFTQRFDGDRQKVLSWDCARFGFAQVAEPTGE